MREDKKEIHKTTANKDEDCSGLAIAIDGPAGAGKSTIARLLADRLDFCHIDTGAMYRAVTLAALRGGLDLDDEQQVAHLADQLQLAVEPGLDTMRVILNGEDITEAIRDPAVSANVSRIARLSSIRQHLVQWQRHLARTQCVVMDGRDIGTHVLPDAPLKIFLTASLSERARRRVGELSAKGLDVTETEVQAEISRRDSIDSQREVSPLVKAPDAVEIDSSSLGVEEVLASILEIARTRGIKRPTGE